MTKSFLYKNEHMHPWQVLVKSRYLFSSSIIAYEVKCTYRGTLYSSKWSQTTLKGVKVDKALQEKSQITIPFRSRPAFQLIKNSSDVGIFAGILVYKTSWMGQVSFL